MLIFIHSSISRSTVDCEYILDSGRQWVEYAVAHAEVSAYLHPAPVSCFTEYYCDMIAYYQVALVTSAAGGGELSASYSPVVVVYYASLCTVVGVGELRRFLIFKTISRTTLVVGL